MGVYIDKSYGCCWRLIPFANKSASEVVGSADSGPTSPGRFPSRHVRGLFDPRSGYCHGIDCGYSGGADEEAGPSEPGNAGWSKGRKGCGAVGLGPSLLDPLSNFAPMFKRSEFASRNVEGRKTEFAGLALDLPLRALESGELLLNS